MDAEARPRLQTVLNRLTEFIEADNIADLLGEEELKEIGLRVVEEFGIDERSNEEWAKTAKKAMDIALQVREPKNYPFDNASNVKWPLITVAALQFNARAYPEIVSGDKIVKAKVIGDDSGIPVMDPQTGQPVIDPQSGAPAWKVQPGAKQQKADRISEHMSYQLLEEMDGWDEDTDTLLIQLPIIGHAFRKVYRGTDKNCAELVSALDVVVNRATKSLDSAPRITHKLPFNPQEIKERVLDGRWVEAEFGEASDGQGDLDAPHQFLEQHRYLDLDKDGYREPYIVTVHQETSKVVRIVANYREDDVKHNDKRITRIKPAAFFVPYRFIPDPKGGFYGIGFGRLLESLGAAIDTTMNQMLDAGHLQNAGGGFIGSGVRLKKGSLRLEPGAYKTVDASGPTIKDAIVSMEFPGPSAVLFNLLGLMIEAAKDITGTKDILVGDSGGANQTATTTLALIEQGLKVFSAIYKRIYRSLKAEFKILFRLNAEYMDDTAYFNVMDTPKAVAKEDYQEGAYDVCPQADPRMVTDMQRMKRAEAVFATLEMNPEAKQEILRRYYVAIGTEDVEKLLPQQQPNPAEIVGIRKEAAIATKTEAEAVKVQAETEKVVAETQKVGAETGATVAAIQQDEKRLQMDAAGLALNADQNDRRQTSADKAAEMKAREPA